MKKIISLLKIGRVDQSIFNKLKKRLEISFKEFNITVNPQIKMMSLENSEYNKERDQYHTLKLLTKIKLLFQDKHNFRILGIIDYDIYANSYNFLFGQAESPNLDNLRQSVGALISITRLRESFYRRLENEFLFEQRVLKEAIHELGHTFGLHHCHKFCIMRFSNSLADTDYKPSSFCNSCLQSLRNFFKNLNNSF
jgi:archaemetzincin